jgi:hypothetical protein
MGINKAMGRGWGDAAIPRGKETAWTILDLRSSDMWIFLDLFVFELY